MRSHRSRVLGQVVLLASVIGLAGCSATDRNASPDGGSLPADCQGRIAKKYQACGAQPLASDAAKFFCGQSPSESTITCYEKADCQELNRPDLCKATAGPDRGVHDVAKVVRQDAAVNPAAVTLTAVLKPVDLQGVTSSGTLVTTLATEADSFTLTPKPHDELDFQKLHKYNEASGTPGMTLVSPELGNCKVAEISVAPHSDGKLSFTVVASDQRPALDCNLFVVHVKQEGIEVTYQDVPYLNSSAKATVDVKLSF